MTNHEAILAKEERAHQLWMLKFNREYNELRGELVEKYGEAAIRRKEKQLSNDQVQPEKTRK